MCYHHPAFARQFSTVEPCLLMRPFVRMLFPVLLISGAMLFPAASVAQQPKPQPLPQPDERYKADILLVVAHPDDEGAATPYLARAIDEGKRVAVVYTTHGSSGSNEAGAETAAALGAIREIEARRALGTPGLGITNVWFIPGKDTAGQNVLVSLGNWGHAEALEQLIRLVRLTRPEIILTFLPGTFIGEDHGDHQACGVLATEAFDMAGDPAVFPAQIAGPMPRLPLENLRPWQTKKIYFFPDADNEQMFRGKGPQYSVSDISKITKQPYWRIALESFRSHQTQAKNFLDTLSRKSDAELEKMTVAFWGEAQHFVLGKSVVGGNVTGDMFENIKPGEAIAFLPRQFPPEPQRPELSVELGGPWSFYSDFRREHGLTHLPHPEPPEIALQAGTALVIPLWIRNQTDAPREVTLAVDLPTGWKMQTGEGKFQLAAKQVATPRIEIALPALGDTAKGNQGPQEVTVRAESNGQSIGGAKLRVELRKTALPE
jgi:LmbE family N-acetylglucosaminyl deacetylase